MRLAARYLRLAAACLLSAAVSCSTVYEWPAEEHDKGVCEISLSFDTDLPILEHPANRVESGGVTRNHIDNGFIRHTV